MHHVILVESISMHNGISNTTTNAYPIENYVGDLLLLVIEDIAYDRA